MDWSFLDKYKHREIENGFMLLEITPVETLPEIFICVDQRDDIIMIFDGGSINATLKMIYNFSSKIVIDKFLDICDKYDVSSENNVIFLNCTRENFDTRLQDFIKALNEICRM